MKKCENPKCSVDIISTNKRRKHCSPACKTAVCRSKKPKKRRKVNKSFCLICDKKLRGRKKFFCSEKHSRVFHHKRERKLDNNLRIRLDKNTTILVDARKADIPAIKARYKEYLDSELKNLKIDLKALNKHNN